MELFSALREVPQVCGLNVFQKITHRASFGVKITSTPREA
jgi:hypothetical protein